MTLLKIRPDRVTDNIAEIEALQREQDQTIAMEAGAKAGSQLLAASMAASGEFHTDPSLFDSIGQPLEQPPQPKVP